MPTPLTTRQQVNGYRFLLRRLEHALMRRDVRMLHDPMRSQFRAATVGIVLALLVTGGFAVYGFIKPVGSVGDSKIIASKESGGLFVVIDDVLHPVLNLASARLITGEAAKPTSVAESKLANYRRGPLVGIPGAPQNLPGSADTDHAWWSVCDTVVAPGGAAALDSGVITSVVGARPQTDADIRALSPSEGLLVSASGTRYLLADGRRFRVADDDDAVTTAFSLNGVRPRPVSVGMLNAFPEGPDLATPTIPGRGRQSGTKLGAVGSVIEVPGVAGSASSFYVVLADSIQKVDRAAADVVRFSDRASGGEVREVGPASITGVTEGTTLPLDGFPATAPTVVSDADAPVGCLAWDRPVDCTEATLRILAGRRLPVPEDARPVQLASADGPGSGLDAVYIPPSTGDYVVTTGADPDSPRRESLVYVNDSGVRFGIADAATGTALGLGDTPAPAPWPIVELLAPGPALSARDALVERDSIGLSDGGVPIAPASTGVSAGG